MFADTLFDVVLNAHIDLRLVASISSKGVDEKKCVFPVVQTYCWACKAAENITDRKKSRCLIILLFKKVTARSHYRPSIVT